MLWNTMYLERAAPALGEMGKPVDDELLHYLPPLFWEHVNPYGRFDLDMNTRIDLP